MFGAFTNYRIFKAEFCEILLTKGYVFAIIADIPLLCVRFLHFFDFERLKRFFKTVSGPTGYPVRTVFGRCAMGIKKYINDYRKEDIIKPNGKPGMTATYIGKYYCYVESADKVQKTGFRFALLSAAAFLFCVIPFCFDAEGSHTVYVALPHVIALFPLVHLLMGIYTLRTRKPPLIREFKDKTESRITTSSAAAMCIFGVTAIGQGVNSILAGFPVWDVIYFICICAACAAVSVVFFNRKTVKLQECDEKGNPK